VLATLDAERPEVCVVDSVQTLPFRTGNFSTSDPWFTSGCGVRLRGG
jgi:hypothetical protein